MANTIYLMKTASFEPNTVYYKVGFTSNILKRIKPYITHNPSTILLQTVTTYEKTGRQLEKDIHKEIEQKGLNFEKDKFLNIKSEWFQVNTTSEFYKDIEKNGLKAFKSCKQRKTIEWCNR